ncbi:MAG TPA: hypothetical protein VHX16_14060 [Chloroflexota bacterium]|jgi:uncharacterized membrane protein|nr:hypothetical protein [Chloroflexota bacterium]
MPFELTDALIVLIRWVHGMAAVLWIGAAFAILAIHSGLPPSDTPVTQTVERAYRDLTDVAIPIFLLTGALLTFERFSRGVPSPAYVAVLSAKLVLAFGMFHLGYAARRMGVRKSIAQIRGLCAAGAGVVLLATVLKALSGGVST